MHLDVRKNRIVLIDAPFTDLKKIKSLPNAYWNKENSHWSVPATPVTALRLIETFNGAEVSFSDEWQSLAIKTPILKAAQAIKRADASTLPSFTCAIPPWDHQKRAYWFARPLEGAMLAMDMGTGKSKVAVDLCLGRNHRSVLVSCPSNVMGVWAREFARHAGDRYTVQLLRRDLSVAKRLTLAQLHLSVAQATGRPAVTVINHEAVWRDPIGKWIKSRERPFDCFIMDESHRGKQHNGQLGNYISTLWQHVPYRLALTGTPFPHDQLDIFAQFRMLDPGVFGMSWTLFKEQYAVLGGYMGQTVIGINDLEDFQRKFELLSYQVDADDVLDLPDCTETFRTFQLEPSLRKTYNELDKVFYAEVRQGEIIAPNSLVKLLRLQQLTSGYCKVKADGTPFEADLGKDKINLLKDLLTNDLKPPVVVFCRFKEDLRRIDECAKELGFRYGEVSGARSDLTDHATMPEWVDVLGVQMQSGGLGIDLTRARIAVFYSVSYKLDDYEQCKRRLRRPGQSKNVHYIHLVCENSIDEVIYDALTNRRELIDVILGRNA